MVCWDRVATRIGRPSEGERPALARLVHVNQESLVLLTVLHTFANPIQRANLCAVIHGVQCEVHLWQRLLLPHCADGIVEVLLLMGHRTRPPILLHGLRKQLAFFDR